MPNVFDPDRLFRPSDDELRAIATTGTLAVWRCEGRGPAYITFGNGDGTKGRGGVRYLGSDLNQWLADRRRVPPKPKAA